jgi:hypothetical protein
MDTESLAPSRPRTKRPNHRGLYHPKYRDAHGAVQESPTWWARYRQNGREIRESTGTTNFDQARRFLHGRLVS